MSALGHVWTAPSWQGLSSRVQHWSVQPCVRPVDAVHMTAGHNALRGSGPGQKDAFDDALAHVGCPDRRIDRLCITCCSPSQPSHHTGCPMRSGSRRQRSGLLVSLAFGHHRPRHPGDLVGERDGHDLRRPPRQQCCEPRSMFGAVDFGIADHCQRAGREQAAQIAIASFADNCRACLCRHSSSASARARSRLRNPALIGTPSDPRCWLPEQSPMQDRRRGCRRAAGLPRSIGARP